ncbi:hypothetical protein KR054_005379 [Drosophila jambulina]|nr:hypothetical protein KR054_005379 [Drosophila jambulina]
MQRLTKSLRFLPAGTGKRLAQALLLRNGPSPFASSSSIASYSTEPVEMSFELYQGEGQPTQPPLITMHGLFGSKQNWRGISRALVRKIPRKVSVSLQFSLFLSLTVSFQIYAVDARNHGESPHSSVHTSGSISEDVRLFLEQHQAPKAACLGHSMGGRAMMFFARKYPELVERLIIVDISPVSVPRGTEEMKHIFDAMLDLNLSPSLTLSEGRKIARESLLEATEDGTVDFIMLNLRKDPQTGAFSWACNAPVLRDFLTRFDNYRTNLDELPPYTGPTTFICGSHSSYMRLREHWPEILEMFPAADIHWLDAGHLVHFEQPQEFISIVTDFLK